MSCCPTDVLPVKATYAPQGDQTYIVGSGTRGILFIPDIFGPHPNTFRVCDTLAARGFLCLMPDFFRGGHWSVDEFPPKDGFDGEKWQTFCAGLAYDKLKERVERGVAILKALGATSVGAVGFCWGGMMVMNALADGLVQSGASAHPSLLTVEGVAKIQGPFCILPSKEDGELLDVWKAIEEGPHGKASKYQYFPDMHHGWCAARAEFDDDLNRQRTLEAIEIFAEFFNATL